MNIFWFDLSFLFSYPSIRDGYSCFIFWTMYFDNFVCLWCLIYIAFEEEVRFGICVNLNVLLKKERKRLYFYTHLLLQLQKQKPKILYNFKINKNLYLCIGNNFNNSSLTVFTWRKFLFNYIHSIILIFNKIVIQIVSFHNQNLLKVSKKSFLFGEIQIFFWNWVLRRHCTVKL